MMRKITFWMTVMTSLVLVTGKAHQANTNHNGKEHDLLCGLLGAAVKKWKTTNHPGVKEDLAQAIFGNKNGKVDPGELQFPYSKEYSGNREVYCGKCHGNPEHYPGKSIPHDLICLCTVGTSGYPFVEHSSINQLCGKERKDLGCENCGTSSRITVQGWSTSGNGKTHLENTWNKIVKPCLQKGDTVNVDETLKKLAERRSSDGSPNWGSHHNNCGGHNGAASICVGYSGHCGTNNDYPQWWEKLEKALSTPNLTPTELNSTTFNNNPNHDYNDVPVGQAETSSQSMPQKAASAVHSPEETRTRLLSLSSNQQSSTSLTHPLLCLLSASFFI
ncbi:Variant surface glycoprotein [Trypanosoma congolense IL3000]|uniref:Variant surface glycoprotein n=1 Tax=Trypanosoma congolense (strain IL3000) TaxID=1068625 RepID=F9WBC4_TRYCI|nr:Variant surface glycoprotein [Trypanosoma congolense IL3000]